MKAATYARFSSDQQRDASLADQERNCARRIEDEGWQLVAKFDDKAISGSTADRPGYQRMLAAADRSDFDVLVVDDLSRLSRDQVESERVIRRLEFRKLRIIGVSDGYDSHSKSRKVQRGVRGLMNELYLDDLREKTHRGLAGQALKQYWAGGKPYGYKLVRLRDETRMNAYGETEAIGTRIEIDPELAAIVREIFERFADDWSTRAIAEELNRRGIPSPGSTWAGRKVRRGRAWMGSAIYAMLDNPLYRGEYVWNVSAWIKDPDTGKRRSVPRPEAEWVRHDTPELRIVSPDVWRRVLDRKQRSSRRGDAVRAGQQRAGHGRAPKFLFSGLLECKLCGSKLIIGGGQGKWRSYICSTHHNGGPSACSNGIYVGKDLAEARLLGPIQNTLLQPEYLASVQSRVAALLATTPTRDHSKRLAELDHKAANLADAIADGALRHSAGIAAKLAEVESEIGRLRADDNRRAPVVETPLRLVERYRALVANLSESLGTDPDRGRAALRQLCGRIVAEPDPTETYLIAEVAINEKTLIQLATESQMSYRAHR